MQLHGFRLTNILGYPMEWLAQAREPMQDDTISLIPSLAGDALLLTTRKLSSGS